MTTPHLHILVVEDNANSLAVLEAALRPLGAQVTPARNGAEALRAYGRQRFDVVLMDLQMPVVDGYEAMRMIRSLEQRADKPRVPVVVVSAHDTPQEVAAAKAAGADMHLAKPISVSALLVVVEAVTTAA